MTTIGPAAAQIEYRLEASVGCSLSVDTDAQVAYRLDSDRPLEWVGQGLREVGIDPGSVLDDAGKSAARALSDGVHPGTGEVLVAPKMAVDPRAKLPARALVDAIAAAAESAGRTPAQVLSVDSRAAARYGRMARGIARERDAHRVPVGDLQRVADAAGIDLADVYGVDELATARQYAGARVRVGNRGYDLTLDLPKSYSVLTGLADPELARQLEDTYLDAVRETVTAVEQWAGYGMRGHHGDGQRAERVDGTGMLGWMTVHRTARPVAGQAPDPHLHAHVTLLNMVRGEDGQWSTVGAGGRDIHRHAHAADAFMKARLRTLTRQRWGMQWVRDPRTQAWEVAAVPAQLRTRMSKRSEQIEAALQVRGLDPTTTTAAQSKVLAAATREAKKDPGPGGDLRAQWHEQTRAAGVDPDAMLAAAMPGPEDSAPVEVPPDVLAAWVFRAEEGLTAHRKVTTRADVLAAVLDAQRGGVDELASAEQLVDQVLVDDLAVPLPAAGAVHLSNAERYTSADVVDAERTVLAAARARFATNTAVLPAGTVDLAVAQYEAGAGFTLSAEQRAVLHRLATAGHGVDTVIGVAGAGKTTIMAALRAAYEADGKTVAGAATAAVAAANLQTEAGITSRTVASWLQRIDRGDGLTGVDVLVIDEAAMVDDRHTARLLTAAEQAGTKVIGIGDPMQLKAVGVGGTFAAVHDLIGGLQLTENRRQRDVDERAALAQWRADERRTALQTWADTGRVHVTDTAEQAREAILAVWNTERGTFSDPHDRIERLVMLAHTNADVDALNTAAHQLRIAAGELPGRVGNYQLAGGGQLHLAVGEQVLLRTNDYDLGVLNGTRGVVTELADDGRARVQWRRVGPDGPQLTDAWLPVSYVSAGGVSYGYAITAAKAQGLTADRALVYGTGMDANVLYPAMSRDRWRADLWLARTLIEDPTDAVRRGEPATPGEALQRTIGAYATRLERDLPDRLVITELGEQVNPIREHTGGQTGGQTPDRPGPERLPAERTPNLPAVDEHQADEHQADEHQADEHQADERPADGPRGRVNSIDELDARIAGLPDDALRTETPRERMRRDLARAADPAGHRSAQAERHRQAYAELRTIAAGHDPSGQFTRVELLRRDLEKTARKIDQVTAVVGRAEQVPAGANPAHVPWQQRPYGRVPTDQLAEQIGRAEQGAARAAAAEAERQQAAEQRIAEARAGRGPAMRELEEQRAQLQAAIDAARQAEQWRAQAAAESAKARAARDEIRALETAERNRGRLSKMLRPGTDELRSRVDELHDVAVRADHDQGQAAAAAYPHEQLARRHPDAADRLAALERDWPTRAAEAMRADEQPAKGPAYLASMAFQPRRPESAEALQRRAAGLRDEAALRERMDPTLLQVEDIGRTAQQVREATARTQQAAAQQAEPAHDHHRDYDHSPTIDRGPSLGM